MQKWLSTRPRKAAHTPAQGVGAHINDVREPEHEYVLQRLEHKRDSKGHECSPRDRPKATAKIPTQRHEQRDVEQKHTGIYLNRGNNIGEVKINAPDAHALAQNRKEQTCEVDTERNARKRKIHPVIQRLVNKGRCEHREEERHEHHRHRTREHARAQQPNHAGIRLRVQKQQHTEKHCDTRRERNDEANDSLCFIVHVVTYTAASHDTRRPSSKPNYY